jgi:hypothetical protein
MIETMLIAKLTFLSGRRQSTYFRLCTREHSIIRPTLNILEWLIIAKKHIALESTTRKIVRDVNGKALHSCTAVPIAIVPVTTGNYLT